MVHGNEELGEYQAKHEKEKTQAYFNGQVGGARGVYGRRMDVAVVLYSTAVDGDFRIVSFSEK